MSNSAATFVELCLAGEAFVDDIDDFVDLWHASDIECERHDFLGLTLEEYSIWVERPESLKHILFARKRHMPLKESLRWSAGQSVGEGAPSAEEAKQIIEWLRATGRLAS